MGSSCVRHVMEYVVGESMDLPSPTSMQAAFLELYGAGPEYGGMALVPAYRKAYNKDYLSPKCASNHANKVLRSKAVAPRVKALRDRIDAERVRRYVSHQDEVRNYLKAAIEFALSGELGTQESVQALTEAITLLGRMDGCGNFISDRATHHMTVCNIVIDGKWVAELTRKNGYQMSYESMERLSNHIAQLIGVALMDEAGDHLRRPMSEGVRDRFQRNEQTITVPVQLPAAA